MIKFLILFILLITNVFAKDEKCITQPMPGNMTSLAKTASDIAVNSCHEKPHDDIVDVAVGCLSGGGKAITGMISGFIEILKLLLVDAPVALFKGARDQIERLVNGEMNPIEMATTIANINMGSQSGIWDTAKKYWDAFKSFASDMKNQLLTEVKNFPCLPAKKQSEIICRGVSEVFLIVVSPTKFVQGFKWGVNTAKAMKAFISEANLLSGARNLSVAGKLELAANALRDSRMAGTELLKLRNAKLVEVELPNGEKILKYEEKIKGKDGKLHTVTREVPVDAKTHAIDANSAIGKTVMAEAVKAKQGTGSLVFIDVNHLGKVNYFKGGTQGGDKYLAAVAESLRKSLRPGDMVFKNGGDELVVVLGSNKPETVKAITQRMMNEVDKNPKVREIFRQEVAGVAQKYRDVNKAHSYSDLPAGMKGSLTSEETILAKKSFSKFQSTKKQEFEAALKDQATYRGSVSVGSSLLKPAENVESALARAEKQAAQVKAEYKSRLGHDVSKYNVDSVQLYTGPKWSPPQAMDPI